MDTLSETRGTSSFDEILADFELLDDWEDRYRYVIELGRRLEPLPERRALRRQQGAGLRQPGLARRPMSIGAAAVPRSTFVGDSDAHIVRGLIAILFALYSGKTARRNRRASTPASGSGCCTLTSISRRSDRMA